MDPERDPYTLAGGQARARRPGQHGGRWAAQPHGDVVVKPLRPNQHELVLAWHLRRTRTRPCRLRGFALVLGVLAGLLIRRTIPAMATTLVVFVAARFAESLWIRPHLWTPLRIVSAFQVPAGPGSNGATSIGAGGIKANDWVLSDQVLNGAGHVIGQNGGIGPNGEIGLSVSPNGTLTFAGVGPCPNKVPPGTLPSPGGFRGQPTHAANQTMQAAFQTCVNRLHIRQVVTYQPANRFWSFQWEETAIFLALAFLLAGFCFWWIHRQYAGRVRPSHGADTPTTHHRAAIRTSRFRTRARLG